MDSLKQERGFSSGEKCPDNPYLGQPPSNVTGQHRVPGTQDGAPGTPQRVPGACQAVPGGFVPQRLSPAEAYFGSCQSESCQERLLAPRQRKVTNSIWCPKEYVPNCPKVCIPRPKRLL